MTTFEHEAQIWVQFPQLRAGAVLVAGVDDSADASEPVAALVDRGRALLANRVETERPEIQAWRRAFSAMGLKPTQYRCAAESLLRRLRREGSLPSLHPLVDLCNAASAAYAIPVAALDLDHIRGDLTVRRATGAETYVTFGGEREHPMPGEVVYADRAGFAHARRWTNRQSGLSAVRADTTRVLVVAEALHASAEDDVAQLMSELASVIGSLWDLPIVTLVDPDHRQVRLG